MNFVLFWNETHLLKCFDIRVEMIRLSKNFIIFLRGDSQWNILKRICKIHSHISATVETNDTKGVIPTFRIASQWPDSIAITDQYGDYTYRSLFNSSKRLASRITELLDNKFQERVAFLCPNNASYVLTQWACWMSGQIAVPLSSAHPSEMWEYFVEDSNSKILVTTSEHETKMKSLSEKLGLPLVLLEEDSWKQALISKDEVDNAVGTSLKGGLNPNLYSKFNAMILYTSGTTALPKGVVLSFSNISAQVNSMITAWGWTARDSILHCLPLHHVHGIMNALLTPLHCGARCVMLPKFNPKEVWDLLLSKHSRRITVLTGVPTMYIKLIDEYENTFCKNYKTVDFIKATCSQKVRLMMCGSAPLPVTTYEKWRQVTGHDLLERYGMTEIGMALTNPLNGSRKPGFVGTPMPGVFVRIVDKGEILAEGNEFGTKIIKKGKEEQCIGELQIKGNNIFKEYWEKPEVTKDEFTDDGWFKTGDIAQYIDKNYKILGRQSVDIIKSGGYKISALFVESTLMENPIIKDAAVIGLPDSTWGQKVAAIISVEHEDKSTVLSVKKWTAKKLPLYMIPSHWKIVPEIPRNAMGKINKKELFQEMINDSKYVII